MNKKILGKVRNGNYDMLLLEDGTKIRYTKEDKFLPEKPESMDIKITNKCNMNCPFCHEDSIPDGKHGDILNAKFIETLNPYTELALGGGNPLEHPDLIPFLKKCKKLKLVANITINQKHFEDNQELIKKLVDEKLIYGLGVSLTSPTDNFIELISKYPNAVIHVINGVCTIDKLRKLYNKNLKLLILGYKYFRKGERYYDNRNAQDTAWYDVYNNIEEILENFSVVSFDNLALNQLHIKSILTKDQWQTFYMGDDGEFTMYIDLINKTYSTSSISPINERQSLKNNIVEMFQDIRNRKNKTLN